MIGRVGYWLAAALLLLAGCESAPEDGRRNSDPAPTPIGPRIFLSDPQRRSLPADMRPLSVRSLLRTGERMSYGDFHWDERGARADGPMVIRVDLHRQLLSVFRGGDEIGTGVVLYGADDLPTPRGHFPILAMLRDHQSSRYDAPMPYTLRLTGDGVSIHGSNVREGAATHGCIGIPTELARRLFVVMHRGDPVVIV